MSEQQPVTTSACPHPEAVGKRWGDPISKERQAELQGYLDRWQAESDHGKRKGPFDFVPLGDGEWERHALSGADVYWLAVQSGLHAERSWGWVPDLHLERANLTEAHLEGAILVEAHLEETGLAGAHLEGAILLGAHLEEVGLMDAHLEGARLSHRLKGAFLESAHLKDADLSMAQLEGASLVGADLQGVDLRWASFDEQTRLADVSLGPGVLGDWLDRLRFRNRNAALGDIKWHDANLTAVPWDRIDRLGDERYTHSPNNWQGNPKSRRDWITGYKDAVRANRQLATVLRSQGLSEDADRFAYRAQICQRAVLLRTFRLGRWLFSWLLFILAGYGYRPLRTLFWYLAVIGVFAFAFFQATHGALTFGLPPSEIQPLPWYEALVLSVSSFHGRGFFQPVQSLGDPVAILAAIEAVFGLFIEVSFIATFTQRYFGK